MLESLEAQQVEALPVEGQDQVGVVTRSALERWLRTAPRRDTMEETTLAPVELQQP